MINEVVPSDPLQDFYGLPDADYLKTTIPLLQGAGAAVITPELEHRKSGYVERKRRPYQGNVVRIA